MKKQKQKDNCKVVCPFCNSRIKELPAGLEIKQIQATIKELKKYLEKLI